MLNVTIRLSPALIEQLDALASTSRDAALQGPYTRSDVIRDALVAHVQAQQKQPSSSRVSVRSMRR